MILPRLRTRAVLGLVLAAWWLPTAFTVALAVPRLVESVDSHVVHHGHGGHGHDHGHSHGHDHGPGPDTEPGGVPDDGLLHLVQAWLHGHSHDLSEPDHDHDASRSSVSPFLPVPTAVPAPGLPPATPGFSPGASATGCFPLPPPTTPRHLTLCTFLL